MLCPAMTGFSVEYGCGPKCFPARAAPLTPVKRDV